MSVDKIESGGNEAHAKRPGYLITDDGYALVFKGKARDVGDFGVEIKNANAKKILAEAYSSIAEEFGYDKFIMFTLGSLGKKYESTRLSDIDAVIIGNIEEDRVNFEFYKRAGKAIGRALEKLRDSGIIAIEYPSDEGDVFLEHLSEPRGVINKLQAFVYQGITTSGRYDNDLDNFISVLADGRLLMKNEKGEVVHEDEKKSDERLGAVMKMIYSEEEREDRWERLLMSAERRVARSIVFTYSNPNLSTELLAKDALSQLKSAARTAAELYNKYVSKKSVKTSKQLEVPIWKPGFGNLIDNVGEYPEYIKRYVEKVGQLRKSFDELSERAEKGEKPKQELFRKFIDTEIEELYVIGVDALNQLRRDIQNTETLKNSYRN